MHEIVKKVYTEYGIDLSWEHPARKDKTVFVPIELLESLSEGDSETRNFHSYQVQALVSAKYIESNVGAFLQPSKFFKDVVWPELKREFYEMHKSQDMA